MLCILTQNKYSEKQDAQKETTDIITVSHPYLILMLQTSYYINTLCATSILSRILLDTGGSHTAWLTYL